MELKEVMQPKEAAGLFNAGKFQVLRAAIHQTVAVTGSGEAIGILRK